MKLNVDIDRLLRELHQLAGFTDCSPADEALPDPKRAVTRVVFTPRDLEARAWLQHLASEAGFPVRVDAVGNTFVRWEATEPELPPVGTGSHTDAIPHAGMYDGTVGVLGALEAMRALQETGFRPRRAVELLIFTSEEPTRFGIGCLGSRLLGGVLAPEAADALPDRMHEVEPDAGSGGTLREVREAAGFAGALASVPLRRGHYSAWLELHIEQGPSLEREGFDCGIVTAIAGPASARFTVEGVGGHAGALLMPDRRDALCAAAELVLAVERAALDANAEAGGPDTVGTVGPDTVGTVGTVKVHPGAVNSVPSRVELSLDLRDVHAGRRDRVMEAIRREMRGISERRGVRIWEEPINADAPVACDPRLLSVLEEACAAEGASSRRMVSRAYHDTSFMAAIAPVAMLFVPCRAGVSHRPDEFVAPDALALGVRVLARALARLASD